jgi:pimeloyl-ACP methyl ester carboxylesterase
VKTDLFSAAKQFVNAGKARVAYYEDIPGVTRVEVLSKAGHLLMEERPEEYVAAVRHFLSDSMSSEVRDSNPSR